MAPQLLVKGLTVIPDVDVDTLISLMQEGDKLHFSKKRLYNNSNDKRRTDKVLNHWKNGEKLTPPAIIVFNAECIESLGMRPEHISTELRPTDGKHRLNAACSIGVKTIPIVVRNPQISLINKC
jgi:hypothetical protein